MFIYPYNQYSSSVKELTKALKADGVDAKIIKIGPDSKFVGRKDKTVVNWGSSVLSDEALKCRVLNHPEMSKVFIDKLSSFQFFSDNGVPHPEWTQSPAEAADWILEGGYKVLARTVLRGNSGQGIVIMTKDNQGEWPKNCKLFTKYVPKKHEYRVHFADGKVIDFQRKALRAGFENPNWEIRNHSNGFVFAREGVVLPDVVLEVCNKFIDTKALDFGAIDVIFNERHNRAYVLEVNTAPGLEGTTLMSYVGALKGYLK